MKMVIVIGIILIAGFWYFQPEQFNNIVNGIKSKVTSISNTNTTIEPSSQQAAAVVVQQAQEGYCIVNNICGYVSKSQCSGVLYTTRTQCETVLGITPNSTATPSSTVQVSSNGYTYYGKPRDGNMLEYNCKTDMDCRYDNTLCKDKLCQCEYSTGKCYI